MRCWPCISHIDRSKEGGGQGCFAGWNIFLECNASVLSLHWVFKTVRLLFDWAWGKKGWPVLESFYWASWRWELLHCRPPQSPNPNRLFWIRPWGDGALRDMAARKGKKSNVQSVCIPGGVIPDVERSFRMPWRAKGSASCRWWLMSEPT